MSPRSAPGSFLAPHSGPVVLKLAHIARHAPLDWWFMNICHQGKKASLDGALIRLVCGAGMMVKQVTLAPFRSVKPPRCLSQTSFEYK